MSTRSMIVLGTIVVVGLCVIIAWRLPTEWRAQHSVVIAAPPERIHPLVDDLHRWQDWARPEQVDASVQYEYSGPERGVGAEQRWEASTGRGYTKIVASDPATGIHCETAFFSDEVNSEATLSYAIEGNKTRVTWAGRGNVKRGMGSLFISSIEAGIQDYYSHALRQLKRLVEEGDEARSE